MKLLFIASFILLQSCNLDYFDERPETFVGKIFLRKSTGDSYLIYGENYSPKEGGSYIMLFRDPVLEASGNDSIIYVKTNAEGQYKYYCIRHSSGTKILETTDLDSLSYKSFITGNSFLYLYPKK